MQLEFAQPVRMWHSLWQLAAQSPTTSRIPYNRKADSYYFHCRRINMKYLLPTCQGQECSPHNSLQEGAIKRVCCLLTPVSYVTPVSTGLSSGGSEFKSWPWDPFCLPFVVFPRTVLTGYRLPYLKICHCSLLPNIWSLIILSCSAIYNLRSWWSVIK